MNPPDLSLAIDEAFPQLDETTRAKLYNKVSMHIMEVLKEKAYANDVEGLQKLDQLIKNEVDSTKRQEIYVKKILDKFASLSQEDQVIIDQELDEELTRVMNKVYKESI